MKNKKLLKTLLTTVSTMAVITGGANQAMGALFKIAADNANFEGGVNIENPGGGAIGVNLADNSSLFVADTVAANISAGITGTADFTVLTLNLNGTDHAAKTFTLNQSNITLGSVISIHGTVVDNTHKIKFALGEKTLTLNGADDGKSATGVPANTYTGVGEIDFGAVGSVLKIDANAPLNLTNATVANAAHANALLDVNTDLIVNNASFLNITKIDIAAGKKMHINVGANNAANTANSVYVFGDAASTLSLEFDTTADHTFTLNKNLVKDGKAPGDEQFTLDIKADHTITVANPIRTLTIAGENGGGVAADQKIGTDAANRITALNLSGADNITFNNKVDVFAKVINHKGTGTVTFTKALNSGGGSALNITAGGNVVLSAASTIEAVNLVAEDSLLTLNGNLTGKVDNTEGNNGKGKILINGNVAISGTVGETNTLKEIKVAAAGNATFDAEVKATDLILGKTGAGSGTATLSADSAVAVSLAHANSVLNIGAGRTLTGAVDNTTGADVGGEIVFAGDGTISGAIGATNSLKKITIATDGVVGTFGAAVKANALILGQDGAASATAIFNNNSTIGTLTLHDNSAVTIANDKTLTLVPTVNYTVKHDKFTFSNADSALEFKVSDDNATRTFKLTGVLNTGNNDKGKIILNAVEAPVPGKVAKQGSNLVVTGGGLGGANTLRLIQATGAGSVTVESPIKTEAVNVDAGARLILTHPDANTDGGITTIGALGGAATVVYRPTGDMDIGTVAVADNVVFAHADSVLKLEVLGGDQRVFTLKSDLVPAADNKGILELHASGNNGAVAPGTVFSKLTLQSDGGGVLIGDNTPHFLKEIVASGDQQIIITDDVDITNVKKITAKKGSKLTVGSTGTTIANINIGEADALGVVGGGATVLVDAVDANIALPAGKALTFEHADSVFGFTNSSGTNDRTVTLARNITTGAADTGILELSSSATKKLTVQAGADKNIGTAGGNGLAAVNITGGKVITTTNIKFAKVGSVNVKAGTLQAQSNTVSAHDITIGNGAVNGTLILDATAETFDAILNGGKTIKFNTADSELQFLSPGAADKTFTLKGNLIPRNSGGNAADETGKLRIKAVNGANTLTVAKNANDTIGQDATHRLKELIVEAVAGKGGVVITPAVFAKDITVLGGGAVTFSAAVTGGDGGTMKISDATPVTLSANSSIETVQLNAEDAEIILGNGVTLTGSISNITADSGKGKVRFVGVGKITGTVGSDAKPLKEVTFANGASEVDGRVNAKKITFGDGAINLTGGLAADGLIFSNNNAEATITDNTHLNFDVTTTIGGKGKLNLAVTNNDLLVEKNIGTVLLKLEKVKFDLAADRSVNFNVDAIHGATEFNDGTYNLQKNLEIDGGLSLDAVTLNLRNNNLAVKNGNVSLDGDLKFNTTLAGNKLGQINMNLAGGNVAFKNLTSAEITVTDTTDPAATGSFDFITLTNGTVTNFDASRVTVTNAPTSFVRWEVVSTGAGVVKLQKINNTANAITASAEKSSVDDNYVTNQAVPTTTFAKNLADAKPGTAGALFRTQLSNIEREGGADAFTEAQTLLQTPIASAPAVISATVSTTQSEIGNRMASLSAPVIISADTTSFSAPVLETTTGTSAPAATVSSGNTGSSSGSSSTQGAGPTGGSSGNTSEGASKSSGGNKGGSSASPSNNDSSSSKDQKKERKVSQEVITGIAAGDNLDRFGVWVNPFYSQGIQKRIFSAEGFKVETVGGSFGIDALVNEDMLVGAALTFASSDLKHKNIKRGDKTKVDTMIGTVYGLYQLSNNLFTQGMLSFGTSDINNNERRRVSSTKFEIANAKYSSTSVGVEGAFGYNLPIANKVIITPTVGLGLSRINDSNYKETGTTAQNLEISKKSITKTDLILGLRGTTTPFIINDIAITPDIHGNVRHDLKGDKNRVVARLEQGLGPDRNIVSNMATKNSRTSYGFGVGLNANYSYMEYGVGYDVQMSRKYVGQQGSLKVKIRF